MSDHQLVVVRSPNSELCFIHTLEGKKVSLEGTWRPLGGHLLGKDESEQTLVRSGVAVKIISTWRVFAKSIYKDSYEG